MQIEETKKMNSKLPQREPFKLEGVRSLSRSKIETLVDHLHGRWEKSRKTGSVRGKARAQAFKESLIILAHILDEENGEGIVCAESKVKELERWKKEYLELESTWDVQQVGKLIGVGIGRSIHPEIQPAIEMLQGLLKTRTEERDALQARVEELGVQVVHQGMVYDDELLTQGVNLAERLAAVTVKVDELKKENDTMRGILAMADVPCIYCGLAKADWNQCAHGFPGCSRADDAQYSPDFGKDLEHSPLQEDITEYGVTECFDDLPISDGLDKMETEPGLFEGDICNRLGCDGVLQLSPVLECSCHISPPCDACITRKVFCPSCEWEGEA